MALPRHLLEFRFEVEEEQVETLRVDCWSRIRVVESKRYWDCQEGFEAGRDRHLCFHVGHLGCSHLCCKTDFAGPDIDPGVGLDDYAEQGSSFRDDEVKVESHRQGYPASMSDHLSFACLLLQAPSSLRRGGQSNQTYGMNGLLASGTGEAFDCIRK